MELDQITSLIAQLTSMIKQLVKVNINTIQTNVIYQLCVGNHPSTKCQMRTFQSIILWTSGSLHQMPNEDSSIHYTMNKSTICRIIYKTTHIRTHITLDGRTTPIYLGATIKKWLDHHNFKQENKSSLEDMFMNEK